MRYLLMLGLLIGSLQVIFTPTGVYAGQWPVEIFDVMDNQRLVIFLRDEDIAASPQWLPSEGGPPLTIADVLKHAKRWIAQDPRLEGAQIHEIELKPIHNHAQEYQWYYLLQLRTANTGKVKSHYAAVLLNGTVAPAIAEPESIK